MTKHEFNEKFIQTGLLVWDGVTNIDLNFMYNNLHFIDSTVSELFDVPIESVVKKRNALGVSVKKEDYDTFTHYKQQGYLKWDEVNYARFHYLYNSCNFSDSLIAELFDVPKREVTKKRKELGISMLLNTLDKVFNEDSPICVSSYLDFSNYRN